MNSLLDKIVAQSKKCVTHVFDGPNPILPIFHLLMCFDVPKQLMLFDPNQDFRLSKSHVFWWTHWVHYKTWGLLGFSKFSPLKTSCLLMDPLLDQNLMCNNGPKTSCRFMDPWWFSGSINRHEVFGSTGRHECTKNSCLLMDPDFQTSLGPS